ncbi:MAG: YkvA family protein, partial [Rivularia sp. ALOHA_DT_140]|nr:YkvA family protein [Rivularia sp. ALOHA_DT_140]
MGIKDRFFGNSKKDSDEVESYKTIDIQPLPVDESTSEESEGFLKRMWNKFRKDSDSDKTLEVEAQAHTEIAPDIKLINQEVETENKEEVSKKISKKNRFQSIVQNIFRKDKDGDVSLESSTPNTVEEMKPTVVSEQTSKPNPNKIKKLFSQLTQKEKQEVRTEEAIEEVEERLEKTSNSSKIKNIFHKLVKSVNTENIQKDIQKITEKLPSMNRGPIKEIWPKIQSLFQMVLDPKAGWTSKVLAIGALLYLVSPFDAIPDIIPIAGLT